MNDKEKRAVATVGELRKALKGVPDDTLVVLACGWDYARDCHAWDSTEVTHDVYDAKGERVIEAGLAERNGLALPRCITLFPI